MPINLTQRGERKARIKSHCHIKWEEKQFAKWLERRENHSTQCNASLEHEVESQAELQKLIKKSWGFQRILPNFLKIFTAIQPLAKWKPYGTQIDPKWDPNGIPNGTQMGPKLNPNSAKMAPKSIINRPKRPQSPSGHSKKENECQLTPKKCPKRLPNGSQMASKTIIFRCTFPTWFLKQFVSILSSILTSFWLPFPIKNQYKIDVYFPSFLEVQVTYFST